LKLWNFEVIAVLLFLWYNSFGGFMKNLDNKEEHALLDEPWKVIYAAGWVLYNDPTEKSFKLFEQKVLEIFNYLETQGK